MPLYEIIPLEAVVGTCCVLDLYTYCKGKKHYLYMLFSGIYHPPLLYFGSLRCTRIDFLNG